MSKISELIDKIQKAEENREEVLLQSDVEIKEIAAELDKVVHEFIKKVKSRFRGVNIYVECDERGIDVYLGGNPKLDYGLNILKYNKDIYKCNSKLISSEVGSKIRNLHIEYFGEL